MKKNNSRNLFSTGIFIPWNWYCRDCSSDSSNDAVFAFDGSVIRKKFGEVS